MASNPRFLMCPPDYYSIDYVINPWMVGNVHQSKHELAVQQWQEVYGPAGTFKPKYTLLTRKPK